MLRTITIENQGKRDAYLSSRSDKALRAEAIRVSRRNWPYLPADTVKIDQIGDN